MKEFLVGLRGSSQLSMIVGELVHKYHGTVRQIFQVEQKLRLSILLE